MCTLTHDISQTHLKTQAHTQSLPLPPLYLSFSRSLCVFFQGEEQQHTQKIKLRFFRFLCGRVRQIMSSASSKAASVAVAVVVVAAVVVVVAVAEARRRF